MPVNSIPPLSIAPLSSSKKDSNGTPNGKPPDVEAGVTGVQVHAIAPPDDEPPDGPRPGHIDITI